MITTPMTRQRRFWKKAQVWAALTGAIAVLTGCVAGPASQPTVGGRHLAVCAGTRVSNAPPTDERGRLRNFDPVVKFRGVWVLLAPTAGCLSSGYGKRPRSSVSGAGRLHKGIDLYTRTPAPFYAAADGKVSFIGKQRGYGRLIILQHANGVETRYAHLSSVRDGLRVGQSVQQGAALGKTGRTGNATAVHLHYEVLINGRQRNPLLLGQ
ncbi:MAG: M23 family metallopeptidase [Pseudomonadota bacterium]